MEVERSGIEEAVCLGFLATRPDRPFHALHHALKIVQIVADAAGEEGRGAGSQRDALLLDDAQHGGAAGADVDEVDRNV